MTESDPLMSERVILAMDAGNTRIKWGVHDGHAWSAAGAIATAQSAGLYEALRPALPVDAAIASNVAGPGVQADIERAAAAANIPVTIIRAQREQLGVASSYRDTQQLGADRWAALVAAHHKEPGHKLVVNAGTALTVDALAGDGRFLGGLIVPGPAPMGPSPDRGTSGLRPPQGVFDPLPPSPPHAITTGAIHAGIGATEP